MLRRTKRLGSVLALMVAGLVAIGPAQAAPAPSSPGGYDEAGCTPAEAHPNPVVLIHGLGAPPNANFSYIGGQLAAGGYCAYSVDYGSTPPLVVPGGFARIDESSHVIRAFIEDLLAETGADEVDIVGHSEGGFHSLYVPKRFAMGDQVGTVVALAPPTHGTTGSNMFSGARALGLMPLGKAFTDLIGCFACDDLAISESAIRKLNDGPITQPGISYTVIATRFDYIVTPLATAFVDEPGVTNLVVQDVCPNDAVGHGGLAFDAGVVHMIRNALDPAHATPVVCSYGFPF